MNNYTNEKERRLYFDDLWVRLKRSWVLVLAITLAARRAKTKLKQKQ